MVYPWNSLNIFKANDKASKPNTIQRNKIVMIEYYEFVDCTILIHFDPMRSRLNTTDSLNNPLNKKEPTKHIFVTWLAHILFIALMKGLAWGKRWSSCNYNFLTQSAIKCLNNPCFPSIIRWHLLMLRFLPSPKKGAHIHICVLRNCRWFRPNETTVLVYQFARASNR